MARDKDNDDAQGCGFGSVEGYKMWRINSLKKVIKIDIQTGVAEKLVLDANLPSNRAPNTYAGHMQLSHRSGRLAGT